MMRKIVQIDEARCDGCGLCIPSCAEGAIALVDGKARLSADALCDGLGACLGECPQGAITVIEREAADFDEAAVKANLAKSGVPAHGGHALPSRPAPLTAVPPAQAARPRLSIVSDPPPRRAAAVPARARARSRRGPPTRRAPRGAAQSRLGQWPVQLHLVPVTAPYFQGADLLVAADCVPFAYAGFHDELLAGRALVVGCPKLDDNAFYAEKLTGHPHPLRRPQRHRRAHGGAVLRRDRDGRPPRGRGVGQVDPAARRGGGGGRDVAVRAAGVEPERRRASTPTSTGSHEAGHPERSAAAGGAESRDPASAAERSRGTTPRSRCTGRRRRASSRRAGPCPTLRPRGPPRAVRRRVLARPRRADRHVAIPSVPRGAARPRGASGDRAGGALDVVGRHVQRLFPRGGDRPPEALARLDPGPACPPDDDRVAPPRADRYPLAHVEPGRAVVARDADGATCEAPFGAATGHFGAPGMRRIP